MKRFLIVSLILALSLTLAFAGNYKIGFFAPLTGWAAADGSSALQGAELGIEYVYSHGGVNGNKLELIHYDDAMNTAQAVSIAYKLVQQDHVLVAISGSYSSTTRAAAGIYQMLGIPMISAYAVHPQITKVGNLIFRVGTLATVEGRAGAYFAVKTLGAKRIAVLTIDNDFGSSLTQGFVEEAKKLGAQIVYTTKYPIGETEFRTILDALKNSKPDVIYATAYYAEASHIVYQAKQLGIYVPIIGQEGYDSPKFIQLSKDNASNGTLITTDLNRNSSKPIVQWFLKTYKEKYGISADMVSASTFDAVQVAARGLKNGTTADKIREGILSIKSLQTSVTDIEHYTKSREVYRPLTVQIVLAGKFHSFYEITEPSILNPEK